VLPVDEQAFAEQLAASVRLERGAFFTPAEIVTQVLDLISPLIAEFGQPEHAVRFIDPACGAGAFLSAVAARWPGAQLLGVDLEAQSLAHAARRVPRATLLNANALTHPRAFEGDAAVDVWLGNPPYNGTSPLLRNPEDWRFARGALPDDLSMPRGTSLRDDYLFFLLRASKCLESRAGVLAFVTSATLLDAFQHAPIRQALLRRLSLRQVIDLGGGAFRGTRVRTCITVWSTRPSDEPARFGPTPWVPHAPEFALRPTSDEAEALDAQWRSDGIELTTVVPVSSPGLKTRFDELLVDDDAERLLARLRDFVGLSKAADLEAFAHRHALPDTTLPKLRALYGAVRTLEASKLRPFHRYRGAQPMGPPAFCYLERALIPRGDHRLRGEYDPHAEPVKLVFNVNELPLAARVLDAPGCVTAYRHARFAPLWVPERVLREGLTVTRLGQPLGPPVANLSLPVADPRAAFERIAAFVGSDEVQRVWAPAFGTRRILPVPLRVVTGP